MRLTEEQFQRQVTDLCDLLGLKWHHETDSRRSKAGFPDLVIAGPYGVVFAELKTEKGRVSKGQQEWIDALDASQQSVYVWRPSQLPQISTLLHLLAGRRSPSTSRGSVLGTIVAPEVE